MDVVDMITLRAALSWYDTSIEEGADKGPFVEAMAKASRMVVAVWGMEKGVKAAADAMLREGPGPMWKFTDEEREDIARVVLLAVEVGGEVEALKVLITELITNAYLSESADELASDIMTAVRLGRRWRA